MGAMASWSNRETRASLLLRLRPDSCEREVAWQEFHDRYAPIVSGFARKLGMRNDDVADLIQEVMLGFFRVSPQFSYDPAKGRFRGYLKTCTLRLFEKRIASRGPAPVCSLEALADDALRVDQLWNDIWEEDALRRAVEIVRREYAARPDGARTFRAFEMSALLEQSPVEIGTALDMSLSSVYQAKRRVGQAIRAAMNELSEQFG